MESFYRVRKFSFLVKKLSLHNSLTFLKVLLLCTWVGLERVHRLHRSDSQGPVKWTVFQNTWLLLGRGEINDKCLQKLQALKASVL